MMTDRRSNSAESSLTNDILRVAEEASRAAGAIILSNMGSEISSTKANSRDLLTVVDPLCEERIREIVLGAFPDHSFLGEEDVLPGKEASAAALDKKLGSNNDGDGRGYLWIVDPIDGTTNFVHGMPLCMPSIACTLNGEVIAGVIHDPHRDETFTASKQNGAYLNGKRIHVSSESILGDAIVAMGSPPAPVSLQMSLLGVEALMPEVRTVRMLGSAALMLAWVACGRLSCYWEYDLSSWDVAAGSILVREAGGKFTDLEGVEWGLRERKICASNGCVHDEVLRVLNGVGVR